MRCLQLGGFLACLGNNVHGIFNAECGSLRIFFTAMICPTDETVIFDAHENASPGDAVVECFLTAEQFVDQGASALAKCLGEGPRTAGMIQGSRFCCAMTYDSKGLLTKALISPEEMTVNMALEMLRGDTE